MNIIKKFSLARQEITEKKLRAKLRTTLFTSITATIFFLSIIAIVYYLGSSLLKDKAVESQQEMARALASSVAASVTKEAEVLGLSVNVQMVVDAIKKSDLKYRNKGEKEIQRYLMDMDKRWIEAPEDHPILKDYIDNNLSLKLGEIQQVREELASIIITDRFGALVGATFRPSGFYSFDKDWWLGSYAKGHGKFYIGGVEYDEHNNLWCLPFSVPIDDENKSVIGVCRASVSLDTFFKPLADFNVGKTGDAVLVDDKAFLIYHQKAQPFANKFCEYEELQKTMRSSDKYGVLDSAYLNKGKKLVAYSEVANELLSIKDNNWFVFVERDLREIFMPLYRLIFLMVAIGTALIIILALAVFILSGQEPPNYSTLQVIKETIEADKKTKEDNPLIERAKKMARGKRRGE
jgi:hypothetical protein